MRPQTIQALRLRLLSLCILLLTMAYVVSAGKDKPRLISPGDVAAIRAVLERYRTSWLAGDRDAVRACLTQDAVLLPHHGTQPVVGMHAINEFWFPTGSSRTTITRFVQKIDELAGEGTLAYVRGRSEVAWTVEADGKSQDWRNAGNFLAVLKKQADGKWLISHLIWDDPPNERLN
jgi:uncharacterized protein (TIGR02246 family)